MTNIQEKYKINKNTFAILPAKEIEFNAFVLEKKQTIHVQKTPLQLIKEACLHEGYCSFNGRREAVMHHTGFKQKVPIPIIPKKGIFAFPTHALKNFKCSWIFVEHILRIEKYKGDNRNSVVHFRNGRAIIMEVSQHILQKQMQRTLECKYKFEVLHK